MGRSFFIMLSVCIVACRARDPEPHWVTVRGADAMGRVDVDVNRVADVGGGVTDAWFRQTYTTPHHLPTGALSSSADVRYRLRCSDQRLAMLAMIGYAPDGHQLFAGMWPPDKATWAAPDSASLAGGALRGYCRGVRSASRSS